MAKIRRYKPNSILTVVLDTETAIFTDSAPSCRIPDQSYKAGCYAIGVSWFENDYLELVQGDQKLDYELIKNSPYKTFIGKGCEYALCLWLKDQFKRYDLINLHIYNASYDQKYLEPYLIEVFGGKKFNSVLKSSKDIVYSQFDISTKKKLKICDPYNLIKCSLRSKLREFPGCSKKQIQDLEKWMKFSDSGEIEGYWRFRLRDVEIKDKRLIEDEICEWIPWEQVKEQEEEYLWYDVVPLKLVVVSNARMKRSIKHAFHKHFGHYFGEIQDHYLYNKVNTAGELFKFFCNAYLWAVFMEGKTNHYSKADILRGRRLILECYKDSEGANIPAIKDGLLPNIYKALFQADLPAFDVDTYLNQNNSFQGGFTSGTNIAHWQASESFPIGYGLDINSQYPYIMSLSIPVGKLRECPLEGYDYDKYYLCTFREDEYGDLLPTSWKDKYAFVIQSYLGTSVTQKSLLCYDSLLYLHERNYDQMLEMCNDVPDIRHVRYKTSFPFLEEFIYFLMDMKTAAACHRDEKWIKDHTEAEIAAMTTLYQSVKLILNNGYGKMCEKPKRGTLKWCNREMKYIAIEEWHEKRNKKYVGNEDYDLLSGSTTPAHGKWLIIGAIKKVIDSGNMFLYCDTDSIYLSLQSGLNLHDLFDIHDTKLGAFKLEKLFDEFIYPMKSKKYLIANKGKITAKFAGVSRDLMDSIEKQCPEILREMYLKNENFLLIKSGKRREVLENKIVIIKNNKSFNPEGSNFFNHYGERESRGLEWNTGVIYEIDGKIHYKRGLFKNKK